MADDGYKQAKADEKAARARAKALRPWYRKKRWIIGGPLLGLILLGVIGGATSTDEDGAADPLTAAAGADATTAEQASVIEATREPTPVRTAAPTRTPTPAPTPEPPIVFEGVGDDIVTFEPKPARIVRITGNAANRHFSVWSIDRNGSKNDLLVNTSDAYEGIVALDFGTGDNSDTFDISAVGPWRIEILPLSQARVIEGAASGVGDEVVIARGTAPTATVRGNTAGRHFAIWGYKRNDADLLVNTSDPYSGRVRLKDVIVMAISAVGPWEITFE